MTGNRGLICVLRSLYEVKHDERSTVGVSDALLLVCEAPERMNGGLLRSFSNPLGIDSCELIASSVYLFSFFPSVMVLSNRNCLDECLIRFLAGPRCGSVDRYWLYVVPYRSIRGVVLGCALLPAQHCLRFTHWRA